MFSLSIITITAERHNKEEPPCYVIETCWIRHKLGGDMATNDDSIITVIENIDKSKTHASFC